MLRDQPNQEAEADGLSDDKCPTKILLGSDMGYYPSQSCIDPVVEDRRNYPAVFAADSGGPSSPISVSNCNP